MRSPLKPNSASQRDGDAVDSTLGRLDRIADLVGCPVETFTSGSGSEVAAAAELLELWLAIENSEHRGEILAYARSLARN